MIVHQKSGRRAHQLSTIVDRSRRLQAGITAMLGIQITHFSWFRGLKENVLT